MDELDAILAAWRSLEAANQEAVLATVVHVTGSAYRRPGARMLLIPDGRRVGTVSGGCLEGEISRKAWWLTEAGEPAVRVYDTSSDDDAVWEFGLGCNGIVHVLLERATSPDARAALTFLDECRNAGCAAVVATVIRRGERSPLRIGQRLLVRAGSPASGAWAASLGPHMDAVARSKRSCLVHLEDGLFRGTQVFVEWVGPPQDLVVFGAGHDAQPVVAAAKSLGWRVTVADGRPAYACSARFPQADQVVIMRPGRQLEGIVITRDTAVVMMTHNYPLDARLLPAILERGPRYLGLLGPNKRTERLFAELGIARPASVHAPVGLDIGCEAPAVIALSIVAEVQAALHGRKGGMLNGRTGHLHAPAMEVGEAVLPEEALRPAYCETVVASHA